MPLETVAFGIAIGAGNEERKSKEREGERKRGTTKSSDIDTEEGTCGEERVAGRESTEAGGIYRWEKRRERGQKERTRGRKRQNEIRIVGGDEGRRETWRYSVRGESAYARGRERERDKERKRERGRKRGEGGDHADRPGRDKARRCDPRKIVELDQ